MRSKQRSIRNTLFAFLALITAVLLYLCYTLIIHKNLDSSSTSFYSSIAVQQEFIGRNMLFNDPILQRTAIQNHQLIIQRFNGLIVQANESDKLHVQLQGALPQFTESGEWLALTRYQELLISLQQAIATANLQHYRATMITAIFAGLAIVLLIGLFCAYVYKLFHDKRARLLSLVAAVRKSHSAQVSNKMSENRSAQKFYSSLDHHLRTPISSAIGLLELAKSSKSNEQRKELLEKATNASFQTLQQVDVLLELINSDTLNSNESRMRFNLNEMLDECLREFAINAKTNNLKLVLGGSITANSSIVGDYAKIKLAVVGSIQHVLQQSEGTESVIRFDLDNAQNAGKLVFVASYRQVEFTTAANKNKSTNDDRVVFAAFEYDQSIVKQLYRQLKVAIRRSALDDGSTQFCIDFPVEILDEPAKSDLETEIKRKLEGTFAVVDDLASSRYLVQNIIESAGGKVELFDCGNDFLTALKSGNKYNTVILDLHMPALSGLETLELVNVLYSSSHVPIIMMSADPYIQSLSLANFPMVEQVLVKPIDRKRLLDILWTSQNKAYLQHRREQLSVLLIEDEQINAEIVTSMLNSMHYKVLHVSSGEEAEAAFSKHKFDVVLVDLLLPDTDGHSLTHKLKGIAPANKSPIFIAVTAKNSNVDRFKSQEAGMSYHLTKPVTAAELNRTISLAMNASNQ